MPPGINARSRRSSRSIAGDDRLDLKLGRHLAFDPKKHPPLSNVLVTLAQKMGVETSTIAVATGTLNGLT
ncbi:MAG: hypothetical protein SH850_29560 [Planctomycetaceae bacterium]|nr:hypothetical protein [Planctomycetaceae bacterium]